MNDTSKTCPGCAEKIKAAAKVCPHCQTKQVRFALWRQEVAWVGLLLAYWVGFIWIMALLDPESRVEGRFVWRGQDLSVESVCIEPVGRDRDYHLLGAVTNRGQHSWRVHSLEVRLTGLDGVLRDALQCPMDRPFVVVPGRSGNFRVAFSTSVSNVSELQASARVQAATDGNAKFDED